MAEKNKTRCLSDNTLMVGLARVGKENIQIRGNTASELKRVNFGSPPHILIIPGDLHFMEAAALIAFAECPPKLVEKYQ